MTDTMDLDPAYLAEQLRFIRKMQGLTQENVANTCGLTTRTIEKLESGRHTPNEQTLRSLSRGLGLNQRVFFKPSPQEEARTRAEILKALRTMAAVRTSITRTARDVLAAFDSFHAWRLDMSEVRDEALDAATRLMELIPDWGDIWSDIPMGGRLDAARGMADLCGEIEQSGHLVHMGRYREQRRFGPGAPLIFNVGLVTIRDKTESAAQSVALVHLTDGAEVPLEDRPARGLEGYPA